MNIAQAHVPRFRALNEEIAKFDQVLNKSLGGVLVDEDGSVSATWSCYSFYSGLTKKITRRSTPSVLTQRPFPNVSELQLCEDGVGVTSRRRDAVDAVA